MAIEKVTGEVVQVGNNNVQTETLNSVVASSVEVKKATGLRKLWRGFFAEDLKTVRGNVMENVVKPSIKAGIANAITSAVYMWLFGKNGYNGTINNPFGSILRSNNIAYNAMYRNPAAPTLAPGSSKVTVGDANFGRYTSTDVYDPEYIRYGSFADAQAVLDGLRERIGKYNVATVKNLMDLSGMQGYEMVLQNWGWYDLGWGKVIPMNDGTWILKLPQPTPLNGAVRSY